MREVRAGRAGGFASPAGFDGPEGGFTISFHTYEDRPACWIGVRLLALSFLRHMPGEKLTVWGLPQDSGLAQWIRRSDGLELGSPLQTTVSGWDVKPTVLAASLLGGADASHWIDADILLSSDIRPMLAGIPISHLVATEEPKWAEEPQGSSPRLADLSLAPGRALQRTANSCFVRVSRSHLPLLDAWMTGLTSPSYREAQQKPFHERGIGLRSDQDVLTALLGSADFRDVPVHLLRDGRDIAQCMHSLGFGAADRLRAAWSGLPPLVHALGEKPWDLPVALSTELSPYCAVARLYRREVDGEHPTGWMDPSYVSGRVLDQLFRGHPSLRALPLAMLREAQQHVFRSSRGQG